MQNIKYIFIGIISVIIPLAMIVGAQVVDNIFIAIGGLVLGFIMMFVMVGMQINDEF